MKMNWWGPLIRISTYLVIEAAVSTSVDMKWNAARVREWWICSSTLQWSGRKFGLCRSRDAKVPRQLTSDANLAGLSLSFKTWWFETKRSVYEFPRIDLLRWRVSIFLSEYLNHVSDENSHCGGILTERRSSGIIRRSPVSRAVLDLYQPGNSISLTAIQELLAVIALFLELPR